MFSPFFFCPFFFVYFFVPAPEPVPGKIWTDGRYGQQQWTIRARARSRILSNQPLKFFALSLIVLYTKNLLKNLTERYLTHVL
jgi:hypothetical protein